MSLIKLSILKKFNGILDFVVKTNTSAGSHRLEELDPDQTYNNSPLHFLLSILIAQLGRLEPACRVPGRGARV